MPFFFGFKMLPGLHYTCATPKSLRISGAAIETGKIAQIFVISVKGMFAVATLNKRIPQAGLDLRFDDQEIVGFLVKGNATVSLTGFTDYNTNEKKDKEDDVLADIKAEIEEAAIDYSCRPTENLMAYYDNEDMNENIEEYEFFESNDNEDVKPPKVTENLMPIRNTEYYSEFSNDIEDYEFSDSNVGEDVKPPKMSDWSLSGFAKKHVRDIKTEKTLPELSLADEANLSTNSLPSRYPHPFSGLADKQRKGIKKQSARRGEGFFTNLARQQKEAKKKLKTQEKLALAAVDNFSFSSLSSSPPCSSSDIVKMPKRREKTESEEEEYQPKAKYSNLGNTNLGGQRTFTGDPKI